MFASREGVHATHKGPTFLGANRVRPIFGTEMKEAFLMGLLFRMTALHAPAGTAIYQTGWKWVGDASGFQFRDHSVSHLVCDCFPGSKLILYRFSRLCPEAAFVVSVACTLIVVGVGVWGVRDQEISRLLGSVSVFERGVQHPATNPSEGVLFCI